MIFKKIKITKLPAPRAAFLKYKEWKREYEASFFLWENKIEEIDQQRAKIQKSSWSMSE